MGSVETQKTNPRELAKMMVGREVELVIEKPPYNPGGVALSVEDLEVMGDLGVPAVKGVSFSVNYGEIFGVAGVEGNGQIELAETLAGIRRPLKGRIVMNGDDITKLDVSERYKRGLAYIPEDRKVALIMEFSVLENTPLTEISYNKELVNRMGFMKIKRLLEKSMAIIKQYGVVTPSIYAPARSLSGGNQQRLVVGRELMKDPRVIIAVQPTRGLDVAATEYVRNLLVKMRSSGKAVILISSDLDEILGLSDRFTVMYNGRFMGILEPDKVTDEELGLMMGGYTYEEIKARKV
jgi:simple sugar transport system ATP-binding protein